MTAPTSGKFIHLHESVCRCEVKGHSHSDITVDWGSSSSVCWDFGGEPIRMEVLTGCCRACFDGLVLVCIFSRLCVRLFGPLSWSVYIPSRFFRFVIKNILAETFVSTCWSLFSCQLAICHTQMLGQWKYDMYSWILNWAVKQKSVDRDLTAEPSLWRNNGLQDCSLSQLVL